MKNLKQYINESLMKSKYQKCKTFKSFFKLYTGCSKPEELDKDDFDSFDYGYLFNHIGISYEDFIKWVKSVWNKKIDNVTVQDLSNTMNVEFDMEGEDETFSLDFIDE